MKFRVVRVGTFQIAGVSVSKIVAIVSFDGSDSERGNSNQFFQEFYRMKFE